MRAGQIEDEKTVRKRKETNDDTSLVARKPPFPFLGSGLNQQGVALVVAVIRRKCL